MATRLYFPAVLGMTLALMAVPSFRLSGQSPTGTDPRVLGTWRLNVAKSKFRPGPPYREEIRIYEAHEQGVRSIIKRVLANGRQATIEYTANYDSVEYPVTGSSEYNAIRLKKVDDVTFEGVLSHADRVFAVTRRVISEDGRTMTITFQASEFQGTRVDNVMVYDKQ